VASTAESKKAEDGRQFDREMRGEAALSGHGADG
jgi:hypothetical protein